MILKHGVKNNISDIHINAYEDFNWLRYRQNGKVQAKYILKYVAELEQEYKKLVYFKSSKSTKIVDEFMDISEVREYMQCLKEMRRIEVETGQVVVY